MKKALCVILALLLLIPLFACGRKTDPDPSPATVPASTDAPALTETPTAKPETPEPADARKSITEERAAEYGGKLNLEGELDWRGDPAGNEVR